MEAFVNSTKKKMKRKDVDQVSDDFSDFSLSSPARKIRRLDAELPPIMEDGEADTFMAYYYDYQQMPPTELRRSGGPIIEELEPQANEERAIVLFKPVSSPILQHQSSSTLSVSVDPNLISEFKNRNLWVSLSGNGKSSEDEEDKSRNKCTAVVPWYPNQYNTSTQNQIDEMEAEPVGEASMEIEEEEEEEGDDDRSAASSLQQLYKPPSGGSDSSGLPQWQYCMAAPQFPSPASSPIYWYR